MDNYDKTLIINPNFYLAYIAKGSILANILSDNVKSLENYHKALMLVSGEDRPALLRMIGTRYSHLGFIEKAKQYYNEAFELDGDQANHLNRLAWLEFNLENYEKALMLLKRINEIDTTAALFNLHFYLYPPGHDEEAFVHAKKIIERFKNSGVPEYYQMHRIGYIFYKMGKYKEADGYFKQQIRYVEESIRLGRVYSQNKNASYDIAATYAFLGDKEKAYQNLDEFNTMDFYSLMLISFVKNDPLFASIHNEERFKKILQNMEAKYQAEHERVRKWLEEQGML
jgi:tetratricopeptide (TPR) repeat protein